MTPAWSGARPGLVVTLSDAQRDANGRFPRDASPDDLVVHQQDIEAVLNALCGAQAPRPSRCTTSGSSTPPRRAVWATPAAQRSHLQPPYVVTAIGDAGAMQAALGAAPLVTLYKQYVVRFGLGYSEQVRADVEVAGYTEPCGCATPSPPVLSDIEAIVQVTLHGAGLGRRQLRQLRVHLVQYLGQLGLDAQVWRNDDPRLADADAVAAEFDGILLSPGPGTPNAPGLPSRWCARARRPAPHCWGSCLGHQAIGVAFGGTVDRAPELLHGKTSTVYHTNVGVLHGLPNPFTATRYHSLTILPETVPAALEVDGQDPRRRDHGGAARRPADPRGAVPPESILTEGGHRMLANWLGYCGAAPAETLVSRLEKEVADTVRHATRQRSVGYDAKLSVIVAPKLTGVPGGGL